MTKQPPYQLLHHGAIDGVTGSCGDDQAQQ